MNIRRDLGEIIGATVSGFVSENTTSAGMTYRRGRRAVVQAVKISGPG